MGRRLRMWPRFRFTSSSRPASRPSANGLRRPREPPRGGLSESSAAAQLRGGARFAVAAATATAEALVAGAIVPVPGATPATISDAGA